MSLARRLVSLVGASHSDLAPQNGGLLRLQLREQLSSPLLLLLKPRRTLPELCLPLSQDGLEAGRPETLVLACLLAPLAVGLPSADLIAGAFEPARKHPAQ